jgi:uncharacterized protein YndB with AHSA1/START domain
MAHDDYEKTIRIVAEPDAVFDALTTTDGLTAWWTPAAGSGATGGELVFTMNAPDPCVMHVDEATRPTFVQWTVTECNFERDWVGTRPTFTITPVDGGASEVGFVHQGLTPQLECIDMCRRGWDHYITILRDHVERGEGSPNGSPKDLARRAAAAVE